MTDTELIQRLRDAALLIGEFTLRSGRTSKYYLDKYLFETQPDILRELGERFASRIAAIEGETGPVQRLAGAELGGIPLVTAASMAANKPSVLIRNQKKDYGTAKQLEGKLESGDRVIMVEDVATTGGQALEAAKVLRELGAQVVRVITAIDRQEGAQANFESAGVPFESLFTKTDLGINE